LRIISRDMIRRDMILERSRDMINKVICLRIISLDSQRYDDKFNKEMASLRDAISLMTLLKMRPLHTDDTTHL